jgi:hypothetical protein
MSLLALILLSQTVIRDNNPQIRLGHRGAPFSMKTQSRITCNLKHPTELEFSANRTGVQLLSPKPRLAEDKFDAAGLREALGDLGNLRDWNVTCLGTDVQITFRGYDQGERPTKQVAIRIRDGEIMGFDNQ